MKALPFALNVVVLGVAMCVSAGAHAEITLYTDRAAFLAAVPGTVTDNLDDLAPGWKEKPRVKRHPCPIGSARGRVMPGSTLLAKQAR